MANPHWQAEDFIHFVQGKPHLSPPRGEESAGVRVVSLEHREEMEEAQRDTVLKNPDYEVQAR